MDEKIYKLLLSMQEDIKEIRTELENMRTELKGVYSRLKGAAGTIARDLDKSLDTLAQEQQEQWEKLQKDISKQNEAMRMLEEKKLDKRSLKRIG